MDYGTFLDTKRHFGANDGFDAPSLPGYLFDFQRSLVAWAIGRGRCAIFADCGMGKTPMQLVWADSVVRRTNKPVLVITPLAVGQQTERESCKFEIPATRSAGGQHTDPSIVITNYEKLHKFDPEDFAGVVCDESSAIKGFGSKRRAEVTDFMRRTPYRLLCTATAAPNDYIELGTSSEALGIMGQVDMLNRFFRNDANTIDLAKGHTAGYASAARYSAGWRFKGHAEVPFWRWLNSWARACRKPSDLGPFDDSRFHLPELTETYHIVEARTAAPGMLFAMAATNMQEEREERRRTIQERCEKAAELVNDTGEPAVVWCHLNSEGDLLEQLIPDGRQIAGSHTDEQKEEAYEAFSAGKLRVLITKPKIGAWGLNWQHCAHVVTFASHSYEQYYQSVRRCWRFGQERPVRVDLIYTEGEERIKANLQAKSDAAERMFTEMVAHMNEAARIEDIVREEGMEVPQWL